MNKTRKVIFYFILAVIIITGGVFLEVQRFAVPPEIEADAEAMYWRIIYFDHFPKINLFHGEEFEYLRNNVVPGEIWWSPELAFVPLIFDEKSVLYTTSRFLALPQEEQDSIEEYYITDLQTFQEISGWSGAKEEFSQLSINEHGNPFWVFDPYLAEQIIRSDSSRG